MFLELMVFGCIDSGQFCTKVSSQPQYSFGLRSMKMVTTLAATELQKEMTRKRRPTISSITEESPSENG